MPTLTVDRCCEQVEIFDIGTDITVNNADFEENPEVASYEYKLPNGWDGSGGGTVVVKSPPSAPNGPWGAGSASAQGAANGDYFMSIRAHLCFARGLVDSTASHERVAALLQRARATTSNKKFLVSRRATRTR